MFQTAWRAISDNDLWIAATAARHARPLVTRNVRNFDNLPGVVVLGVLSVVPQSVFVNAP